MGPLHDLFTTDHTHAGMHAPTSTFTQKHNTGTVLAQTWTVALCPIEFAGPVAEHNKVFTLRHFSERERVVGEDSMRGVNGCDTEKGKEREKALNDNV